jgi:adenylate cyclase
MKALLRKVWSKVSKLLPIWLICGTIMGASWWALRQHYFRFAVGANERDPLYRIESSWFDIKVTSLRGPQKPTGKVGILAIDDDSIHQFGRWPFSRRYYDQAFKNLKKHGVKWIGFDSVYDKPERPSLDDIEGQLLGLTGSRQQSRDLNLVMQSIGQMKKMSPADQIFREALQNFGNIVLGYFYMETKVEAKKALGGRNHFDGIDRIAVSEIMGIDLPAGKKLSDFPLMKPEAIQVNDPIIDEVGSHFAFFNNDADQDAINRWLTLVADVDGHLMPCLALKTVAEYLNREIFVFFNNNGIESLALINRDDPSDSIDIPVDSTGKGRVLINPRGRGETIPHYGLAAAYRDDFTEKQKKALKDSVLLLGATATGINDMRPNAFDPTINGAENHAAVMDNIVRGDFYKRPASIFKTEMQILLVLGVIFTLILSFGSGLFSGLALITFLVGYYYVDKYFWMGKGIWTFMVVPAGEVTLMFGVVTLYKYVTEEKEKKMVKGAFQHYLSPEVIDQVLQNPEQLKLGGEKKELTVFFSDVRGFTTISETLTPEKLSELMNEYFTPMTGIVLRSKGVLDKYIGDAIMAFWGAPLELENPAETGCQAAIEMLYALDKLRTEFKAKGFPDIDIGIGLNTGPMSVGNMGSGERFTYTVMGDAVNLGSRLEGLTKEYGIKIMISEFTHAKLTPGKFFTRDLDDIRVKGKNEPVKVFHLMRPDFLPTPDLIREFIAKFELGRKAYTAQKWEDSRQHFVSCLQMKPDDKASIMYCERIDHYIEESPGQQWDGVYTFKHK